MPFYEREIFQDPQAGRIFYGLLKDIQVATKVAQAVKLCKGTVHNFDRSQPLIEHMKTRKPVMVLLDWDGCEAEGFKVLKEMRENADLKSVPSIGYVSGSKPLVREEAQRAGCLRVYLKTEWMQDLPGILARYL